MSRILYLKEQICKLKKSVFLMIPTWYYYWLYYSWHNLVKTVWFTWLPASSFWSSSCKLQHAKRNNDLPAFAAIKGTFCSTPPQSPDAWAFLWLPECLLDLKNKMLGRRWRKEVYSAFCHRTFTEKSSTSRMNWKIQAWLKSTFPTSQ